MPTRCSPSFATQPKTAWGTATASIARIATPSRPPSFPTRGRSGRGRNPATPPRSRRRWARGTAIAEEENIAGELHGHLTQMLRTAMSGGLQVTEQRDRRLQQEAEAERRAVMENARQLDERKRAELEMNVLLAQQRRDRQDT